MVPMVIALSLSLAFGGVDDSQIEGLLKVGARRLHHLTLREAQRVLLPIVEKVRPEAEWRSGQHTLDGRALIVEFTWPSTDLDLVPQAKDVVIWRDRGRIELQQLDPGDERFLAYEAMLVGDRLVRCGNSYSGGNYDWSAVQVYRRRSGHWVLVSTEDADHEPERTAHFLRRNGRIVPTSVVIDDRVYPDNLEEPHAGPKLWFRSVWRLHGDEWSHGRPRLIPNPLAVLDHLAGFAQTDDRRAFDRRVPKRCRTILWGLLQNQICVFCGRSNSSDLCPDLCVWKDQVHEKSDLVIHFRKWRRSWRVVRVSHEPGAVD